MNMEIVSNVLMQDKSKFDVIYLKRIRRRILWQ
jgi:hypothetical protein